MSMSPHDIKDDEIRIITSGNAADQSRKQHETSKCRTVITISIVAATIVIVALCCVVFSKFSDDSSDELELFSNEVVSDDETLTDIIPDSVATLPVDRGFVSLTDTTVTRVTLSIFKPVNLTPTLHIGNDIVNDSSARLVVQAADIRGDNGGIVGAYVNRGELISKGQAKSGFCAIIGGKINIGVADATPLLEQALETDGYFFRQYPLVVANQIVENKPKGQSLRKALAELNGETVVIMSRQRMSFHNFAKALVDLGVSNAIYLVGGGGYGFAIDENNRKIEFGQRFEDTHPNTNYIVWR